MATDPLTLTVPLAAPSVPMPPAPPVPTIAGVPALDAVFGGATVGSGEPGKASKVSGKARKRRNATETALDIRKLHWPAVKADQLWVLDGERGGFAQVPRTLSLFSELIIKQAVKAKTGVSSAAGATYNVLWMHTQGQGISRIENEADAALEAGYGGERGITTFRKHIRVLKDLGFIDYVEE